MEWVDVVGWVIFRGGCVVCVGDLRRERGWTGDCGVSEGWFGGVECVWCGGKVDGVCFGWCVWDVWGGVWEGRVASEFEEVRKDVEGARRGV